MAVRTKFSAALLTAALAAVALVGCAPAPGEVNSFGCTPMSEGDGTALNSVEVKTGFGEEPEISVPGSISVPAPERRVLSAGAGRKITSLSQTVYGNIMLFSSADGSLIDTNLTVDPMTGGISGTWGSVEAPISTTKTLSFGLPTISSALTCAQAGTRVVVAVPLSEVEPNAAASLGLTPEQGLIAVVDIYAVDYAKATGSDVFNTKNGLPAVVRASNGQPGVTIPAAAAPSTSTTEVLIDGESKDTLTATGAPIFQYSILTWGGGDVVATSWGRDVPELLHPDAMPVWMKSALVGQPIGSQVLLVLTPEDAGSPVLAQDGSGLQFPTGETLVVVVDLLGQVETAG